MERPELLQEIFGALAKGNWAMLPPVKEAARKSAPHCSYAGRRLAVLDWPEAGSLPLRPRNPICAIQTKTQHETQPSGRLQIYGKSGEWLERFRPKPQPPHLSRLVCYIRLNFYPSDHLLSSVKAS